MDTGDDKNSPPSSPHPHGHPHGHPHAHPHRRLWLLAALALALVTAGVVSALVLSGTGRDAPVSLRPPAESPPSMAPGDTAAVFLGDSYTQGWGASTPSLRWSALVAAGSGWVEVNQGEGGTGFVSISGPGGCGQDRCPTYLERVPEVLAVHPAVVVIAGGQNDLGQIDADPAGVRAAVDATYDEIRQGQPDARIIAVGPSLAQPANAQIETLDRWVRAAAARVGAEYVSLLEPDVIEPDMVASDGVHVNDAGHRAIADRVLGGIRAP